MNKQKLNFIIDALMFVVMIAIISIGIMMKYVLISGTERWIKYGMNPELSILGMDRHDWGYIHLILGYIIIGFLILHVVLHWKSILCLFERYIINSTLRLIIGLAFIIISLLILTIPWIIEIEISPTENRRNSIQKYESSMNNMIADSNTICDQNEGFNTGNRNKLSGRSFNQKKQNKSGGNAIQSADQQGYQKYDYDGLEIEVYGYMTLKDISIKYNVQSDYLKKELNLPSNTSETESLGHLRRIYGFKMYDIEEIIYLYIKSSKVNLK